MTEIVDHLAEKIVTPENKERITNFLSVVRDVVSANGNVSLLETGNRFILSQKNGIPQITVSLEFLQNMGDFELVVDGSTPFENNVCLNMSSAPQTLESQDDREAIEFLKEGDIYRPNVGNGFLECLDDIRIVNMLKRPSLPQNSFNMAKAYLEKQGFRIKLFGEDFENEEQDTTLIHVASQEPTVGQKVVIKEVPVYIDKLVIKEVPVEVQKVVIKEVPVYIDAPQKVDVLDVKTSSKGPIQEPSDSSDEESEVEESEVEESDEKVEESSEEFEESDHSAYESAVATTKKIKGKWLNPQKTVLKSGEFVYRVNKKVNGPPEMLAIGRWDGKKQIPLKKGDKKIIKKLGNKVA